MSMGFTVPDLGDDAELDKIVEEAARVMTAGKMSFDPTALREMMAKRLAEARGEKIDETPVAKKPKKDAPPEVDVKAGAAELSSDAVTKAVAEGESYFYNDPEDHAVIKHFVQMRRVSRVVGNMIITGPSGAGKTEGIIRVGRELGLPVYKMDCATVTTEDKWIGHKDIDDQGTHFRISTHLRWLEGIEYEPGIVLYDEVNRVHPSRLNVLLPILDGSQAIFVPDAGQYVNVHPDTVVMATANIGAAFGGTFQFDRALRERFAYTVERKFPPLDEEVKVLVSATGIEEAKARRICEIATTSRRKWETGDLEAPISTRTLKAAAMLISSGMSIIKAFEYTALPLYKADGGGASERQMVKLIIDGKGA